MSTLKSFATCRITIPFLVITNDGREALVDIKGDILADQVPAREISESLDWASVDRDPLIAKWKELN